MAMVVGLAIPFSARAADAGCAHNYTLDHLLADLLAVETALRADDGVRASERAEGLHGGLACLDALVPRMVVGRAYRAIGAGYVAGGDPGRGEAWLRTAVEVEGTFDFGLEDLPPVHPVRTIYEDVRQEAPDRPERVEDREFLVPAFLDGRRIDAPVALPGRPHLLQLDVTPVRSWTIAGADFPEEAFEIEASGPEVAQPSTAEPPEVGLPPEVGGEPAVPPKTGPVAALDPDDITLSASRKTPWEKTPLIIGGAALGLAAGGVYAAALERRRAFNMTDGPGSTERVAQLRPVVNRLTVASWALSLAGAGTLAWGVILNGPGGPMPGVRVRL